MPLRRVKRWEKIHAEDTPSHQVFSMSHKRRHLIYVLTGHRAELKFNQVISNTGFESPCSTKGESCRFSPLETPSASCPPQEAGFTLNVLEKVKHEKGEMGPEY